MVKFLILCTLICVSNAFGVSSDPNIDLRKAKAHIDQKVSEAIIELHPFPHIIIDHILPDDVYQKLLNFWPDSPCFDKPKTPALRHLPVTNGCVDLRNLQDDQRCFWRCFGEIIMRYVKEKVTERLMPFVNHKFPYASVAQIDEITKKMRFCHLRQDGLFEHTCGYYILPHIDQAYLLATMLLYCPVDDSHVHCGTCLYKTRDGLFADIQDLYDIPRKLHDDEAILVKKAPYLPNTLLVMLQCPAQWHGADLLTDSDFVRRVYIANIYFTPEFVEEIYGTRHYSLEHLYYKFDLGFLYPNF